MVYERLIGASLNWYDLGGALGLDINILDTIDYKYYGSAQNCLREMIAKRLQSGGPLIWRGLCDSLRSPTVKRNDVASEIEHQIGGLCTLKGVNLI